MNNPQKWRPSKYIRQHGRLIGSRDPAEVWIPSRLLADLVADWYDANIRLHAKGRLLDLGCGKVPLYETYRDYVTENICVDWGNSAHQTPHLDLEHDINQPLPFSDATFETVILSDVLEHVPEPVPVCAELARVLSPGGKLLATVPFFYWVHEEPHDYYRYTEYALKRFMDRSGLTVLQMDLLGTPLEIITDILAKQATLRMRSGHKIADIAQRAVGRIMRSNWGRRIFRATTRTFPFEIGLVAVKP